MSSSDESTFLAANEINRVAGFGEHLGEGAAVAAVRIIANVISKANGNRIA